MKPEEEFIRKIIVVDVDKDTTSDPRHSEQWVIENERYSLIFAVALQEYCGSILQETDSQSIHDPNDLETNILLAWKGGVTLLLHKLDSIGLINIDEKSFVPDGFEGLIAKGTRESFFSTVPSGSVAAEIGVDNGGTARDVFLPFSGVKDLTLIDPWDSSPEILKLWPESKGRREHVEKTLGADPRVTVLQDFSFSAAKKFDDGHFDWISSDWALEYSDAREEISTWMPKIKKDGFLMTDTFCLSESRWGGAYSAWLEFVLVYVIKRPDLLLEEDIRTVKCAKTLQSSYLSTVFTLFAGELPAISINTYRNNHILPDILTQVRFYKEGFGEKPSQSYEVLTQISPSREILEELSKSDYIEYVPSPRNRAGGLIIRSGEWMDGLDFEKIKEQHKPLSSSSSKWIEI